MHFVCVPYAFPYAYIFVPSALRTRLFLFLYALYAVFSGVVFSHSVHSRFFDAYNAYKLFWRAVRHDLNAVDRLRSGWTGNEANGVRTCLKTRAVENDCPKNASSRR